MTKEFTIKQKYQTVINKIPAETRSTKSMQSEWLSALFVCISVNILCSSIINVYDPKYVYSL